MGKWINDKTLDLIQVLVFVVVLGVYAFSIKFPFLVTVRYIFLMIGAALTVCIMIVRFTLADRLTKKQGRSS